MNQPGMSRQCSGPCSEYWRGGSGYEQVVTTYEADAAPQENTAAAAASTMVLLKMLPNPDLTDEINADVICIACLLCLMFPARFTPAVIFSIQKKENFCRIFSGKKQNVPVNVRGNIGNIIQVDNMKKIHRYGLEFI
jgi:hypothetical protein